MADGEELVDEVGPSIDKVCCMLLRALASWRGEPVVALSFKVDQASDLPRAVWRYRNVTGSTLQNVNALQVLATCQAGLIRI